MIRFAHIFKNILFFPQKMDDETILFELTDELSVPFQLDDAATTGNDLFGRIF